MNVHLVMLGAPGSGKGTQAKILEQNFGYRHLSTGDLLRKEIESNSSLGKQVKEIINSGKLVEDDLVIRLLKSNCDLSKFKYIFDGFPRNLNQAQLLHEQILSNQRYSVIYFDVNEPDLVKRIVNRRICEKCGKIYNLLSSPPKIYGQCDSCLHKKLIQREDDKEEILKNRLEIYLNKISDVLKFYRERKILFKIDGLLNPQEIFEKIRANLNAVGMDDKE